MSLQEILEASPALLPFCLVCVIRASTDYNSLPGNESREGRDTRYAARTVVELELRDLPYQSHGLFFSPAVAVKAESNFARPPALTSRFRPPVLQDVPTYLDAHRQKP